MVEMSGEQSFQFVLGGSASQRNESDHIVTAAPIPVTIFPVLIPDESGEMHPETGHLSLEAKSSGGEQAAVKRKRGRPRKIKPEEQNESGKINASLPDQHSAGAAMKRGRSKRSEQATKREVGPGGEASMPVKRGRGRPKKVTTSTEISQSQVLVLQQQQSTSGNQAAIISSEGITSHASTDIFNAVQQLAQDAVIVSAIHGTPVQVLPTTAVATMNTIDSDSALRISAPISVAISPTRDDATEWTASTVKLTPPSRTANEKASLEKRAFGTPLVYQVGASTPPLLHAEQPEVLNSLPQCSLSSGEVSVKIVDRLAGLKESDGCTTMEQVHHGMRYLKQPEEGIIVVERQETKVGNTARSSLVIVSGERDTKTQERPAEAKTQLEQPPVKRKRGRPPKNRNASQPSTVIQEEPSKKDIDSSSTPSGEILDKPEPPVEAAVMATDPPVVKRKLGRPPKVKTQNVPSESPALPSQATTITTTASVSGEENRKPRKRGRPPKSTKSQVQMTEASGEMKVKRGRGRPRKYPIPAVAASGPFLPSVSGVTLPAAGQHEEQTPTQGIVLPPQIKSKQQQLGEEEERSQGSPATATVVAPVNRKRGRPPKNPDGPPPAKRKPGRPRVHPSPDLTPQKRGRPRKNPEPTDPSPRKRGRPRTNPIPDPSPRKRGRPKRNSTPDLSPQKRGRPRKHPLPGEETVPPRKPGRPRKNPVPDEKEPDSPQNQQEQQTEQEKEDKQASPEITQKETSPIIDVEEISEPLPKRKRGRPKKIPPVAPPPQEPTLSSSADESTASLTLSGPEKAEDEDSSSTEVVKLSLQISFSDSDSEHSEKVESNAIMALADRVVAPSPSPSPPRQLDSPLLNPSFEESYDEDSDPDSK